LDSVSERGEGGWGGEAREREGQSGRVTSSLGDRERLSETGREREQEREREREGEARPYTISFN
jgi:hypothetical protein